jgi:hypothetical protein
MTPRSAPAWLEELQTRFSAVIRTPLDRTSGTLTATPSAYDANVLGETLDGPRTSGAERLAVYNRQYWFRLFDVMQTAFPLTTRLSGHWTFNDYAARFLLAHPPRGWDLDRAPDGFEVFMSETLEEGRLAVMEAARIDAAWRSVFGAPQVARYRPSPADAARLLDSHLTPSPAVALVEEHWPLLELRKSLRDDRGEAPVALPTRLPTSRWWALVRRDEGIGQLPLEAREAELFTLLRSHTVSDALGRLEAACAEQERAALPTKAQGWLARSVELDFWTGLVV